MSIATDSAATPPDFDRLYSSTTDPWAVADSWYTQRKLAVLMAALPFQHYGAAWEPGCGPGLVSTAIAPRVDELLASDSSSVAVELAGEHCSGLDHVTVIQSALPDVPVNKPVDLIVAAEFLYYLPHLKETLDALWSAAAPGAHLAFMHWAHRPDDAYRSGPDMHAQLAIDAVERDAMRVVTHQDTEFMLDIYQARP